MDVVYFFTLSQMLYNDFNFAVRFWTCEAVPPIVTVGNFETVPVPPVNIGSGIIANARYKQRFDGLYLHCESSDGNDSYVLCC